MENHLKEGTGPWWHQTRDMPSATSMFRMALEETRRRRLELIADCERLRNKCFLLLVFVVVCAVLALQFMTSGTLKSLVAVLFSISACVNVFSIMRLSSLRKELKTSLAELEKRLEQMNTEE